MKSSRPQHQTATSVIKTINQTEPPRRRWLGALLTRGGKKKREARPGVVTALEAGFDCKPAFVRWWWSGDRGAGGR